MYSGRRTANTARGGRARIAGIDCWCDTPGMSSPPDYNKLAQQYLSLWQEQIANAATDPAVADNLSRMMAGWQSMMGAVAQATDATGNEADGDSKQDSGSGRDASSGAEAGAAPSAAASVGADDALRRLNQRVADLEERISVLEAKLRRE